MRPFTMFGVTIPFHPILSCRATPLCPAERPFLSCRALARHPHFVFPHLVLPSNPSLSCRAQARHPSLRFPPSLSCRAQAEASLTSLGMTKKGRSGRRPRETPRLTARGDMKEGSGRHSLQYPAEARFPFCPPEARKRRGTPRLRSG